MKSRRSLEFAFIPEDPNLESLRGLESRNNPKY